MTRNLGCCDFCLTATPGEWWELPATPFEARDDSGRLMHKSDGPWAACRTCRDLLDTGQLEDLVQEAANTLLARQGIGRQDAPVLGKGERFIAEAAIRVVFGTFVRCRTGPSIHHAAPDAKAEQP